MLHSKNHGDRKMTNQSRVRDICIIIVLYDDILNDSKRKLRYIFQTRNFSFIEKEFIMVQELILTGLLFCSEIDVEHFFSKS